MVYCRVQTLIAQKIKPFEAGTIGLFARKARCASCGYVMRSSKNRGVHYLQCANRHIAKDACTGAFISVDQLELAVVAELTRLSKEYLDKDELEHSISFCDDFQEHKARICTDIAAYDKKISEYAKGILSEADYIELSKDFISEKERLERIVMDSRQRLTKLAYKNGSVDNRRGRIEQYINLEHLNRETVETMIDYISVGKRNSGSRDIPIEIHWNF